LSDQPEQQTRGIEMNAIPYDRPEEAWDSYQEGTEEFSLPGRPRRQWFNKKTAALFAVVPGAIGFYAGVRVEKSQLSNSSSTSGGLGTGSAAARLAAAGRAGAGGTASASGATGTGARAGAGGGGFRALLGGGDGGLAGAGAGGGNATLGTVSSIDADTLYITEANGNTVKVTLSSATKVTKNVGVGKDAVRPGDTVITAGAKNSDGTISATTLSDTGAGLAAGSGSGSGSGGSSSTSGSSAVSSLFGGRGG
jgi:hypothetical protein